MSQMKRLANIVVGPGYTPGQTVDHVALARKHDDRRRGALADVARKRKAVLAWQHQIEKDEIGWLAVEYRAERCAIAGFSNSKPLLRQVAAEHGTDTLLIIDDNDMQLLRHFLIPEKFCHCCEGCHIPSHTATEHRTKVP